MKKKIKLNSHRHWTYLEGVYMAELLTIGDLAPEFELVDHQGKTHKLSTFIGKKVVLYFYPKDNTPGCTTEACDFRDATPRFQEKNAVVIGISKDSGKSHQKFIEKFELPFLLLSDEAGDVCETYGVWQLKKNYGKEYMGIVRTTYIIDEKGLVAEVFSQVKVAGHIEKVLEKV